MQLYLLSIPLMMGGAGCVIKKCVSMERTKHDIALSYHGDVSSKVGYKFQHVSNIRIKCLDNS